MAQIPHGDPNLNCPLWKKPMDTVCHKCPLWVQLRGKDPQSNREVDSWNCSLAILPMLMIENAQMQRQTGASTDKVANVLAEIVNLSSEEPHHLNHYAETPVMIEPTKEED
jgi:hypothetical protein